MTTVTRKEYDTQGTETVLGLPCKTVTQNWDGAVTSTKMSILDAFNINDIQVDETNRSSSSQSQSLMSLASNIASVKLEERLIPTSFTTPKVMGFPIKSDGSADISAELVEDTLTEVTLTNPITVKGIPVYKIWKGSDNVSFFQIESSAIMDGRATMQGYKTEGASECVYSALSASDASAIGSLVGKTISNGNVSVEGEIGYHEVNNKKYIAVAFNAKKAMDSICGIGLVGVGVNGGVASWTITLIQQGCTGLSSAMAKYGSQIRTAINGNSYIKGDGTAYIKTDIVPSFDDEYYMKFKLNSLQTILFGCRDSSSRGICIAPLNSGTYGSFFTTDGIMASWTKKIATNTLYEVILSKQGAKLNGTNISKEGDSPIVGSSFTLTSDFLVFASTNNGTIDERKLNGNVYKFSCMRNGKYVCYLVPFSKDGRVGMVDLVSGKDYLNANTNGSFTYSLE